MTLKSGYHSANPAAVPVKGISLVDFFCLETISQLKLMQMQVLAGVRMGGQPSKQK